MVPLLDSQADRHQRAEGVEDAVENLYQLDLTVGEDGSQHELIHDLVIKGTLSGTILGNRVWDPIWGTVVTLVTQANASTGTRVDRALNWWRQYDVSARMLTHSHDPPVEPRGPSKPKAMVQQKKTQNVP